MILNHKLIIIFMANSFLLPIHPANKAFQDAVVVCIHRHAEQRFNPEENDAELDERKDD